MKRKIGLRPEVERFAELMELKMREHDKSESKYGWKVNKMSEELLQCVDNKLNVFKECLFKLDVGFTRSVSIGGSKVDATIYRDTLLCENAANVANYLMFLCERNTIVHKIIKDKLKTIIWRCKHGRSS